MHTLLQDTRYAFRQLRRAPVFALTVVATLAIGIGLNAAIFAVVDGVLLRPLGYHDADRIVALRTHFDEEGRSIPRLGGDDYTDLAREVPGFEATARYEAYPDGFSVAGASFYGPIAEVSARFAEVLGIQPVAGRLFNPDDARGTVALAGESFAREHFGSPAAALGRTVTCNGSVYTIVGVLPAGFSYPGKTQLWFDPVVSESQNRTAYNYYAIGKRRAGVSPANLSAQLAGLSKELQSTYPEDRHKSIEAVPLQEELTGSVRPTLHLLMGAASVILLIILANLTHLQLVRATRELRGVTIRAALGASRLTLLTNALLQAALLALAGMLAAVALAVPALRMLVALAPADIPRLNEISLNGDVLLFSGLTSLLVMAITAVVPVWRVGRIHPASALRQDASRNSESRGRLRLRSSLVVAEIALTLTLSVAAVLLARQLMASGRNDLGFAPETLITLDTHATVSSQAPILADNSPASISSVAGQAFIAGWYRIYEGNLRRLDATLATLAAIPGVESAGAIAGAPMSTSGGSNVNYAIRGRQTFSPEATHLPHADVHPVTPGLLTTLGVPLILGRALQPSDRLESPPVLLVSQGLARSVFPGQNPIGQQISFGYDDRQGWSTIVGVVGDMRSDSPASAPTPTLYLPVAQHPREAADMQLMVRTRVAPATMVDLLRTRIKQAHPDIAIQAATMRENIGETERPERFRTSLLASFAGVSILLAAVGMYGVTSYTVAQRTFEFGLRVALGATRTKVLQLVLRQAFTTAVLGIVLGVVLSLGLARVVASAVGTLPAFDAVACLLASLAVLLLTLMAALVPARAAATVDPMCALRAE